MIAALGRHIQATLPPVLQLGLPIGLSIALRSHVPSLETGRTIDPLKLQGNHPPERKPPPLRSLRTAQKDVHQRSVRVTNAYPIIQHSPKYLEDTKERVVIELNPVPWGFNLLLSVQRAHNLLE